MRSQAFIIRNPHGFHVRPTKNFVESATLYDGEVTLVFKNKRVNGKSSLGVMSLGLAAQSEVVLEVNGEHEEETIALLGELLTRIYD